MIGAESTGKSTLAHELGAHFHAPVVPEFAREYALRIERTIDFFDVFSIARGQMANEDRVTRAASGLVILDTDLVSTIAYSRYYWGACPEWVVDAARHRLARLYLLMECDVPWISDPARDAAAKRDDVHAEFVKVLQELEAPYVSICGTWDERRKQAVEAITVHSSA